MGQVDVTAGATKVHGEAVSDGLGRLSRQGGRRFISGSRYTNWPGHSLLVGAHANGARLRQGYLRRVNWMDFVAALVGHLAWPLAIVVVVLLFRRPLAALIGEVSEGEVGPSGFTFKRAWRRAVETVTQASSSSPPEAGLPETHDSPDEAGTATPADSVPDVSAYERHHAYTIPEGAMAGAYQRLANRLREILGDKPSISAWRNDDIRTLAHRAHELGRVPAAVVDSVEGVGILHDLARSAPERVTPSQAREFQTLVQAVLYTLRDHNLARAPGPPGGT